VLRNRWNTHACRKGFNVLWHGNVSQEFRERATFERAIREGTLWKPPAQLLE
jgi:hypothetical protein